MKFICERTKLAEALSNVQKAVSSKSILPALEGILITAENQKLELCGYNMEMGIITTLSARIEGEGRIVLNARLLTDIVRKLPEETVVLEVKEKLNVTIQSGLSEFSLLGIDPEEFPGLPSLENPTSIEIPVDTIKGMIKQTLFAVSDADSKPIHTGTLFEIADKEIKLISVDGYRMAMRRESIQEDTELRFVVPGKTLAEVLKLLPDEVEEDEKLKIMAGESHITLAIGEYSVVSRLLEGEFLDYKNTVPPDFTTRVAVSTRAFIDSIERVSLLLTDKLRSSVKCAFSSKQIKLSCTTAIGKANDEISCKVTGEELEIGFNNKYMTDALKNSESDEVVIELSGKLSPIKILPKEGSAFLFLVLPIRLKE